MTEMIKEKKETDRRLIMLAITALFFFLMHLTFVGFTNDDYYFRIMKADHGSVLQTVFLCVHSLGLRFAYPRL